MAKKVASKKVTPLAPADVASLLCSTAYDGWTMEHGVGYIDMDGELWKNEDTIGTSFAKFSKSVGDLHVTIALNIRPTSTEKFSKAWETKRAFSGVQAEGHTLYNGRTFTRRGIDGSSCTLHDVTEGYEHEYDNLVALLDGEWQRCADAHARSLTMVSVPGLPGGWRITPARRAQVSADLQASKRATFTPSGMGIGYEIMRTGGRFAVKLPAETSAFFGVTWSLYYMTIDCD